jgi:hypothetical protein
MIMIGVRNNGRHIRFKQTIPIIKTNSIYKNKGVSTAIDAWPKVIAKAPSTTASDTLSNGPPRILNYGVK